MFGLSFPFSFDPALIIPAAMAIGAVFLALQTGIGLFSEARTQAIVNRRLQFKDRYSTTSEAMIELRKSRGLDRDGNLAMSLRWLNKLIVRSGLKFQPARWAAAAVLLASAGAVAAFYYFGLFAAILAFLILLFGAPLAALKYMAAKRAKALSSQLCDALQIACRSLEAGHPVATAVTLVAREMPDPIGSEFGMAADEIAYGMSLTQAVHRMAERVGDPDVELFSATVRLQEKTGGNLTELLKANTGTIRERQTMRLKVKAASAEGRVSALILTAAPFIVGGAIHLVSPEFYGRVIDDPVVQYGFAGLFVWLLIGNAVMNKMINFKM